MAIYLGDKYAGINNLRIVHESESGEWEPEIPDDRIILTPGEFESLQDAVGYRVGDYVQRNIQQMQQKLKEKYFVNFNLNMHIGQNTLQTWARPEEWPDLDSLNLQMSGNDYIYMTYDLTRTDVAAVALHIEYVKNGTPITCTIGHIINGTYIVDDTITGTNNNYVYWFNNYSNNYPVIRILGDITYCYMYSVTNANGQIQQYRKQPIVERIAYIPHLIKFCTSYSTNAWTSFYLEHDKIGNGDGTALTSLYYTWAYGRNLRKLDIANLYTPNVTSLDTCFYQCWHLTGTLDLKHWNVSKVTSLYYAFSQLRYIECIDLTGWDTTKVTTMAYLFTYNWALREIKGIANFNTNNCTSFNNLFFECLSLQSLNLTQWNTSKITNLAGTFSSCYSLISLKLSNWNVENVTTLNSTFSNCWSLEELNLHNWHPIKVTHFGATFNSCYNLKKLDISNWAHGTLTTVSTMFYACRSLQELDISNIHVTSACISIYSMFSGCWSLKKLHFPNDWDVSGLDQSNNTANSMFANCYSLEELTGISNWQFNLRNSLGAMFSGCYSLKNLDLNNWKVNTITSFANMFDYCYSLENLNISGWNIQSATNLSAMFRCCFHLKYLDLSQWDLSNCTNLSSMFSSCYSLINVGNLSNWNTSKVTTFADLFYNCRSLKEIKGLSNWDVSKATTVTEIFYNCRMLTELKIENWNLAACTNINSLVRDMHNLKTLSLKNWSIPKITAAPSYFCTGNYTLENIEYTLPIAYNHSYNSCELLSHESLLTILNNLPSVSTTRTLNLTTININSLTTAEKQIATNKGWTLAN